MKTIDCKIHGDASRAYQRTDGSLRCGICGDIANHKWRTKKRRYLVDFFGGKCQICGYNKCYGALEFHHIDPSLKTMNLSVTSMKKNMNILRAEAEKCVLVCANCHREIEVGVTEWQGRSLQNF